MTVKEFSDITGLPPSKIRFYDRENIINSDREGCNNYRSFTNNDALNIYNVQMLRGFDLGIHDVLAAQSEDVAQIDERVQAQINNLEITIREQEIRLTRLKEMKQYFKVVTSMAGSISIHHLEDCYNVWTINAECTDVDRQAIKLLADVMPFSYICIKIDGQSVLNCLSNHTEKLSISLGLGILETNRKKIGLTLPKSIKNDSSKSQAYIMLETPDPFNITKADIDPLLTYLNKNKIVIQHDIVGRIFFSYQHNGKLVHGLCLGYPIN